MQTPINKIIIHPGSKILIPSGIYVKLPKNITYESTVDDVKKEYGEPNEIRDITSSSVALGFINGNFSGKKLTYKYEADETNSIELELYFEEESQKLFMIEYEIHGDIN